MVQKLSDMTVAWPKHDVLEHHASFLHQATLQLWAPPTHVGIRCTETTGSSKQCFTLISQTIL